MNFSKNLYYKLEFCDVSVAMTLRFAMRKDYFKMKRLMLLALFAICSVFSTVSEAQIIHPAKWNVEIVNENPQQGDTVLLKFKAKIDKGWYMYSNDFDPDLGPNLTEINFEASDSFQALGKPLAVNPLKKYDDLWEGDITYFKKEAVFEQKLLMKKTSAKAVGVVDFQVCSDETGQCIPDTYEFDLSLGKAVSGQAIASDKLEQDVNDKVNIQTPEKKEAQSGEPFSWMAMLTFMGLAFLGGTAALLTPCVFPMIPMTVSFFTNSSKHKGEGIKKALIYGLSVIAIYVIFGTIVAAVNGPGFANWMSTHWLPNILFFVIFTFFAMSFLGMFEITLPSSWVNNADKKADKGGYAGVFFMAFTLVLVSFSCTGPIVGTILVESAGGQVLKPILGMTAFASAFAIPFTLFAIFPKWLNNLPKSGGWLNSVKVTLGFLELALGLKFLSVADQVYHWGILDREVYLALWIAIFSLLGLYFLGKIRLPHDSVIEKISVPRVLLAVVTFSFVIYLIPGMFGAPLKALAGYLPPRATHDFDLTQMQTAQANVGRSSNEKVKYADFLHMPHGIQGYFDYQQALEASKRENKPLLIDFSGHGCVNCRYMEDNVWSEPQILKSLKEDFIVVALYVDDKTTLPESEWYESPKDGKMKKTIGAQNADFQIRKYGVNAQPYYVIVDGNENSLTSEPAAYDKNSRKFEAFLQEGLANYASK
ncbi:protein-disulfide reductase DsbD family protein [Aureibacter tunicatorum]|uniref:Thiol:disulfide interchange protein DsbD n=1 Tax=Aureibacter tunicatorum TaxID=866807 RepID=A0AAE3XK82_9BACT|nr:cytochrome c biogenesis protein CcdA [Aureibacter tunicatorum]MDR6237301.1 thiol:disulfide interchange protein DsbD [Aureibacter tunicatorum]BDD06292.1 thiol:disulfide interchange protein DsbD [Aureibacter tunicatorum]